MPALRVRDLWLLLLHYDKSTGEIRYELSRPWGIDETGKINTWSERILFPPIPDSASTVAPLGGEDSTPARDITITTRTA